MLRHVGMLKNEGSKVVVVYLQIPDDPEYALVVSTDSLTLQLHDELLKLVESSEGQNEENLYNILYRRQSTLHNISFLEILHSSRQLQKHHIDNVIMTPNTYTKVPLRTILEGMNKLNKPVEVPKLDDTQVAQNLLVEANVLEQEVLTLQKTIKEKKEKAYTLDKKLKPKKVVNTRNTQEE